MFSMRVRIYDIHVMLNQCFIIFNWLSYLYVHSLPSSTSFILLVFHFTCEHALNFCSVLGNGWTLPDVKGSVDARNVLNTFGFGTIILGGRKDRDGASWMWEDNTPVNDDLFEDGHKDNPGEFCLQMRYDMNSKFRDIDCKEGAIVILCQRQN